MFSFILKRLALVIPTFIGITILVFGLIRLLPGDPVEAMSGERGMTQERYDRLIHEFGLDRPIYVQYGEYVWKALHGDLGLSTITHESVFHEFISRFPATLELSVVAMALALCIGIPAGILAAMKRNTVADYAVMGASLTGYSMPIFWWGLLLILTFSVGLGWTPVSGRIAIEYDIPTVTGLMLIDALLSSDAGAFKSALSHLILPAIVLGTIPLAVIARMTRSAMLEVLSEDYIRTARAKGVAPWRILFRHALQNAAVPVITIIGIGIATLIGSAVITGSVFAIPGVGRLTVDAILHRDYPIIQGVVLMLSAGYVLVNIAVDICYTLLDPRIRY